MIKQHSMMPNNNIIIHMNIYYAHYQNTQKFLLLLHLHLLYQIKALASKGIAQGSYTLKILGVAQTN